VKVTASVASNPPTGGRLRNTANSTDARISPNTELVKIPAAVAWR